MKFGCDPMHEAPNLLRLAYMLDLNVAGFSFHVGSGCKDPPVYRRAIRHCKVLFDLATNLGFKPYLLDLGGGYPGNKDTSIDEIADVINKALDDYFDSKLFFFIAFPVRSVFRTKLSCPHDEYSLFFFFFQLMLFTLSPSQAVFMSRPHLHFPRVSTANVRYAVTRILRPPSRTTCIT